jgi:hypothetical protein
MESLSPFLWGSFIPYNMPGYPGAPPAWIRTRVHATTLSSASYEPSFESMLGPRTMPLVQRRAGHDFDEGHELNAQDIQVGMTLPHVGHSLG